MLGMYAVGRNWISEAEMMQLVAVIIGIGGVIWGAYVNTDKALVQAASSVPAGPGLRTVVSTSPELAAATPNESNIVSIGASKEAIVEASKPEVKPT